MQIYPSKKIGFLLLSGALLVVGGCNSVQDMDIGLAAGAGMDAVKAATISDAEVINQSREGVKVYDGQHQVASKSNAYGKRLHRLTRNLTKDDGLDLNFKVYLKEDVNAFAMADGSIRVYSALMDVMSDQELLAVIGHEIGHVKLGHSKKAYKVAYAASAGRKAAAAQNSTAGNLAASQLGGLVEAVVNAQYSQSDENAADNYALKFMQRHGYSQEALVSALRKLGNTGGGLLSTHPNSQKRADSIESQIR